MLKTSLDLSYEIPLLLMFWVDAGAGVRPGCAGQIFDLNALATVRRRRRRRRRLAVPDKNLSETYWRVSGVAGADAGVWQCRTQFYQEHTGNCPAPPALVSGVQSGTYWRLSGGAGGLSGGTGGLSGAG